MPDPDPDRAAADDIPHDRPSSEAPTAGLSGLVCLRDEIDDRTIRLTISGELDMATAPGFDLALQDAQRNAQNVTVDLRRLSFMDGHGLAAIVAAAERADTTENNFRVLQGPPQVHRLFTLTETDRHVKITPAAQRP